MKLIIYRNKREKLKVIATFKKRNGNLICTKLDYGNKLTFSNHLGLDICI